MKIRLYFKTPDVLYNAFNELSGETTTHEELERIRIGIQKFVRNEECITVEYDTVKQTATVLPVN